jgi:nitrogen fixation NifU-like protein
VRRQAQDIFLDRSGRAISVASASLLTDTVIGLKTDVALEFFAALVARLSGRSDDVAESASTIDLGKLVALEGVKEFPSRVKCATLAWHALNSAILDEPEPATTE